LKERLSAMAINPFEFAQQTRTEISKITWPSRAETLTTTIFVIALVLIAGLFLFAVDQALSYIVNRVLSFTA
jgi:preprotein translocase subunit SecE